MPAPLNILYIGTLPPHPGGTGFSGSHIMLGLARLGHSVRCIAPMTPEALESGDPFAVASPELGIRRYPVPRFEVESFKAPASYWDEEGRAIEPLFAELVAEQRPDVVLGGRESFAWHAPRLAAAAGLPCVVRASSGPWLPLLRARDARVRARELLVELRRADSVVTPAHFMAHELRGLGIDTVHVVPNPVDTERFRPRVRNRELAAALGIEDGDVVILHGSNLKSAKRPLDVVYSAQSVLAVEARVLYLVVGDGLLRADMEEACRAAGVRGRFRFAGWADYDRMPDYLNLAGIVLMPSESEGQSRVCLEAQASGLALLASDIPGAREIVVDGESGILFGLGDIADLTAKTLLLARQPDLRRRLGAHARRRVMGHSLANVSRGYEAVVRAAMRRPSYQPGMRV